ncbi:uncharacterized protein LOC127860584 isoform X2 [Dreissena polymorpha]|uniref:uncharacterized protein LOC127860584 isoform X2 n=1 Tax=Dreissena polymorpha TaxID=45954 RepID=UPI002263D25A|nr:uncharacterized protein LOC127860584 isoform X2 [Dreissena polymorpha]
MCKKYKMMCRTGKVCAVQHFDWPKNISIPVCIPLSFVPLRNAYCQLPADPGRCHARYIRWYFKSEAGECTHFQFGGCDGNQNNFMSKRECETTCMATPTIRLFDDNQPVVIAQPIDTQRDPKLSYEALNSVKEEPKPAHTFDRYQVGRQRNNQVRNDEANTRTRRRLDKEKDKERKRKERERKREKKRLRKLMKQEIRRKLRLEQLQKEREEERKKNNKEKPDVMLEQPVDDIKELASKNNVKTTTDLARETKDMITGKSQRQTDKEKRREERRKERRLQKRREKQRKRHERERQRLLAEDTEDIDEPLRDLVTVPKSDKSPQLGSKVGQGKVTSSPRVSVTRSS